MTDCSDCANKFTGYLRGVCQECHNSSRYEKDSRLDEYGHFKNGGEPHPFETSLQRMEDAR